MGQGTGDYISVMFWIPEGFPEIKDHYVTLYWCCCLYLPCPQDHVEKIAAWCKSKVPILF